MFAIAIFVAAFVIALSWAARRSDVEAVTANNKPDDDDDGIGEHMLELSIGCTRELVDEDNRAKPIVDHHLRQPKQDHIQYLDQAFIFSMLEQAEKTKQSKSVLDHIFGTEKRLYSRDIDQTSERDTTREREHSRGIEMER
jgi:hypothetical protein